MSQPTDRVRRSSVLCMLASLPLAAGIVGFAGCKNSNDGGPSGGSATRLNGGGATFVDPIMQKWSAEYKKAKGVAIDYVKSGSGDGIKGMTNKTLDFGCSDAPMNKKEVDAAMKEGGEVIHIPITMGSVAVVYNLPGVEKLKLSGPVVADIYMGKIKTWNDKAIADLNPGVKLPDKQIVPVYRAEGSGTSFIFTDYLSKVSPEFAKTIGASKSPKWPNIGTGQSGSDGVAGHVKRNEGCIGYVELFYSKSFEIPAAALKNKKGVEVLPTATATTAAAEAAMKVKPTEEPYSLHEYTYPLTDTDGEQVYPICGMSFLILYKKQPADKGQALKDLLHWATTEGQKFAEELSYAPLPEALSKELQKRIDQVELLK
jgi:phosphate transport system substrate-binding protein